MIRDANRDGIVDVINLAHQYLHLAIDGYKLDKCVWITNVLAWLHQAELDDAWFIVDYDGDHLRGFAIGVPTSWHYSQEVYLDIKELFVDEDLNQDTKAEIVGAFARRLEREARLSGYAGCSAFSIRPNSSAYANYFVRKLGWTRASGAKLLFKGDEHEPI